MKPPEFGTKINVDAALWPDGCVGIGDVIRNSAGQFVRARCGQVVGAWQVRKAEALSLKTALSWEKELSLDHCIFESDSKSLVDACKRDHGVSYFHTIVSDCVELCKHFDYVQIVFVRRSANSVAHVLATHSMPGLRDWDDITPEFIDHVLVSDIV